jgi:hypothetical protein
LHVNFTSNKCSGRGADIYHLFSGDNTSTAWDFVQTAGGAATTVIYFRGDAGYADYDWVVAKDYIVRSANLPASGGLIYLYDSTIWFTRGWFQSVGGQGVAETLSAYASFRYTSCYFAAGIQYSHSRSTNSGCQTSYTGPWPADYDFWAPACLPAQTQSPPASGVETPTETEVESARETPTETEVESARGTPTETEVESARGTPTETEVESAREAPLGATPTAKPSRQSEGRSPAARNPYASRRLIVRVGLFTMPILVPSFDGFP